MSRSHLHVANEPLRKRCVELFRAGNSYLRVTHLVHAELGVVLTRNAIAGYVNRAREAKEDIPYRSPGIPKAPKAPKVPKAPKPRKVNAKPPARPPHPRPEPIQPPPAFTLPPIAASGMDAILGRRTGSCGWPVGDPKEANFRYCCAPCEPKVPYCEWHTKLAGSKGEKRVHTFKPKMLGMTMRRLRYG